MWKKLIVLCLVIACSTSAFGQEAAKSCGEEGSEYLPAQADTNKDAFLDYRLNIHPSNSGEVQFPLIYTLQFFEHDTGKELDGKDLHFQCSMGIVTCGLNDPLQKEPWFNSDVTALNKDFSPADPEPSVYALIIPRFGKYIRDPEQIPPKTKAYIATLPSDQIIHYRADIFVPDVWIFNKCNGKK